MNFDVFNGDADGICALLQLRLAEPADSILITGVKRDISLLQRVDAKAGDKVVVLDISLDKNRQPLDALLEDRSRYSMLIIIRLRIFRVMPISNL